jgi:CubicO group peptidase (beta-lactamase class C family)
VIDLAGISTCAVALAGTADRILWEEVAGEARPSVLAQLTTRFDYASLTKPFTATLALVLDTEGVLPLATRIGEVWPEAHRKLARKSLSDLLRHRSGLAAWTPLYHRCRSLQEILDLLLGGELLGARAGTYSDLDYILWGLAAERWTGERLDRLLRSRVLDPLGLSSVEPFPGEQPDLAESRMDTGKESDLATRQGISIEPLPPPPLGWPQDGNARFLLPLLGGPGRLAGHAGLFGGAQDLWTLAAEWLAPRRLLQPEGVAAALGGGGPYALGWQRRTLRGSAGRALSPSSFGLTGFAGNSVWTDPEKGRIFVLLSSRIDPRSDINRWRRRFHSLAVKRR